MIEDWIQIWQSLPILFRGILVNLELLAGLVALGLAMGIVIAVIEVYAPRPLAAIAIGYEWFFRGVPELVLLFLFYFGLRQFGFRISAFFAATLALGFRSSAYQSQIFRGAIQAVGTGQMLAARSLGMGKFQSIIHIILPQALRLSIPPWSNEFSSVLKDTTLAYGIGVVEVLRQARYLNARNFRLAMPAYIVVALMFLLLTYGGNWLLGKLERSLRVPGLERRR